MQRRVKTYGKHSSRIITVTEDKNITAVTSVIQPTINNHVSLSESSDDQPNYPTTSNRRKSAQMPNGNMNDSRLTASHKSQPHIEISQAKPLNSKKIEKNKPPNVETNQDKLSHGSASLPQHQIRNQARPTAQTSHVQKSSNSTKLRHGDKEQYTVRAKASMASDSSDALPLSRPGIRVPRVRRKYIVSDESETTSLDSASEIEAEEPETSSSEADSPSPTSRYVTKARNALPSPPRNRATGNRANNRTRSSGDVDPPSKAASSMTALKSSSRQNQERRAIVISSGSDSSESALSDSREVHPNGVGKPYAGTPQVKASHLRQARVRKGTPFRRIPTISLASTLTLSPISPLRFTGKTQAATEIRSTNANRAAQQPPLPPSSPLTWDESLTPEAVRILDLTSDDEEQSSVVTIERLLKFAGQAAPVEFATFLETFRTQGINGISLAGNREKARSVQRTSLKYRKLGDASYSEVFAIGDLVLKVIPLAVEIDAENGEDSEGDDDDDEVPFKSSPENVLKEIVITKATGDLVNGFIRLLRTYIVKGKYPRPLLKEWDEFKRNSGSDGIRPDSFTDHQLYAIVVLPNGGIDLETYTFAKSSSSSGTTKSGTGWRDAAEVFWQVTTALAKAEELLKFEHRDLHWGQIVVRKSTPANSEKAVISATIIDLGLSRIETEGAVKFSSFEEDLFTGCGILPGSDGVIELDEGLEPDYQFDIYRLMRHYNGDDWVPYRPLTNVMWLHYLSLKLLRCKGLRKPTANARQSTTLGKHQASADVLATLPHMESEWHAYQQLVAVERCLSSRIERIVEDMVQKLGKGKQPTKAKKQVRPLKPNDDHASKKAAMSIESAADVAVLWFAKAR